MNIKFNDRNDSQTKILLNVITSYSKAPEDQKMIEIAKQHTIQQIENRYQKSIVNERYVFPRRYNSHHSSDQDEQSFEDNYFLDRQNDNQYLLESYYIKRAIQQNNPNYSKQLSLETLPHCFSNSLINKQQKKLLNKSQSQSNKILSHTIGHRSFGTSSYEKNRPKAPLSKSGDRSSTNQQNYQTFAKKESTLSILELKKKLHPESNATASSSRASNEKQLQFGKNSSTFTFKDLLENYRISQLLNPASPSKYTQSPTSQIKKCDLYKHLQQKVKTNNKEIKEKFEQIFKKNLQKANQTRNSHLIIKEKRCQTKQSTSKDRTDNQSKVHSSGMSPTIKIPPSRSTSNKHVMKSLIENSTIQGYKHFIYPKPSQKQQKISQLSSDSITQLKAVGKIRISEAVRQQNKKPQNQSYETRDRFKTHIINSSSNNLEKRKRRTEGSENQISQILAEKSQNKTLNELLKSIVRYSTQKNQEKSIKPFF